MDKKLLEILVCPVTKQPLTYDRERQELTTEGLEAVLTARTRLVCFTHVSNIVGVVHDVTEWRELQRQLKERGMGREESFDEARHNLESARARLTSVQERGARVLSSLGGDPKLPAERHPRVREAASRALRLNSCASLTRTCLMRCAAISPWACCSPCRCCSSAAGHRPRRCVATTGTRWRRCSPRISLASSPTGVRHTGSP